MTLKEPHLGLFSGDLRFGTVYKMCLQPESSTLFKPQNLNSAMRDSGSQDVHLGALE